ncbi:HAD-like domain-containing protein [Sporodiniella umbellata]|nr:HAD-like domain-containing protein [Sporodiniella umbellata]
MKFGNYLNERKQNLPSGYAENCIDYDGLKSFLKSKVYCSTIKLDTEETQLASFAQLVSTRLSQLQDCEVAFIEKLEEQVKKATKLFELESRKLVESGLEIVGTESFDLIADLLKKIVTLERFVFLNYTGITKILKKNDRHSGLSLSDSYLQRVASLPLVKAEELTDLKKRVIYRLNEQHGDAPNLTLSTMNSTSPLMVRSRSRQNLNPSVVLPPTFVGPNQKVLVSLSGPHGTDIVGAVLDCLARHPCNVEDFMLSRLYHNVTFGVLITLQSDNVAIFRDLSEAAKKWDANLTYDIPDSQATEPLIKEEKSKKDRKEQKSLEPIYLPSSLEEAPYSERDKYAATILNQNGLTSVLLSKWTRLLLNHRISIEKLQRLNKGNDKISCVDLRLSVPRGIDMVCLRQELIDLSSSHGTDIAFQRDDVFRKNKRLVVFDMDSTLIYQEVIDEIARYAGVVEEVSTITEAAMNGEIDFKESLRRRVALLNGTSVVVLEDIKKVLTFTEGARFLCAALKKLGFKLAVISGGFLPLARYVQSELGLDYAFANQLKVSADGLTLTGETVGPIVDGLRKAELLEVIAQAEGVTLNQVIAVGDGANDLWMLNKAGLGIAFNAKPRVQEKAGARINQKSLKYVLTLLGYSDQDMDELSRDY